MAKFNFNPEQNSFPLTESAQPVVLRNSRPIAWRLWRLDLIYVYSLGLEMVYGIQKEQSCFRRAYSLFVSARNEQAIVTLHESGFFRDLQWIAIPHDKQSEKPIDGWFQYEYVLNLVQGTENQFTVVG